ncbi:MAG: hypothetical protein JWQ63_3911 [Mucilaginibacter sp.]|jgi:hypothetical protein|nr:hypothetical protein [Mucilaginibacter sp.]
MKKVTKLLAVAFTATALFLTSNVKAQTTPVNALRLGIGVEGGIPTGSITNFSNFELGGTARLQYGLSNNLALTLTSGYYNFFAKGNTIAGVNYATKPSGQGLIPIKLGIKAFFTQNLYFGAEAGAGLETNYAKNTKLLLSPGLGYATKSWDVGVRYESLSGQSDSYGTVALRIAYGFGL